MLFFSAVERTVKCRNNTRILLEVYAKGQFLCSRIGGSKRAISDRRPNLAFLRSRKSAFSIPTFSIEQSDPRISSKKSAFFDGCADRIARSKTFLKPTASLTNRENTRSHPTTAPMLAARLLLLLTASQRGTSCSPPACSAYRHPMAAVHAIDNLFATPLLLLLLLQLLCLLWRLSTKSNTTTATMKRMKAPCAPNEHFARG